MHGILRHSPTVWRGLTKLGGIPFGDDLVFDWPSRVDGTLETFERISEGVDNGAFVGGVVGVFTAVLPQYIAIPSQVITDGYIEFYAHQNTVAAGRYLVQLSGVDYLLTTSSTVITVRTGNGTINAYTVPDMTAVSQKIRVEFRKPGSDLLIKIFANDIESVTGELGFGDTTYTSASIGATTRTSIDGNMWGFKQFNGTTLHDYSLNGHSINSIDGIEGTNNNGVTYSLLNSGQLTPVLSALNNGYYYETATGKQVVNPQYTLPVGWVAYSGGANIFHNGINSYFSTNVLGNVAAKFDILDRINQTALSTDSIYYDSTSRITRSLYYVGLEANELDITILDSYMVQADKEKAYAQMKVSYCDIQQMSEFFVYATQKTGTDAVKVHNYINNTCQLVTDGGEQVYHLTLPVWVDLTP